MISSSPQVPNMLDWKGKVIIFAATHLFIKGLQKFKSSFHETDFRSDDNFGFLPHCSFWSKEKKKKKRRASDTIRKGMLLRVQQDFFHQDICFHCKSLSYSSLNGRGRFNVLRTSKPHTLYFCTDVDTFPPYKHNLTQKEYRLPPRALTILRTHVIRESSKHTSTSLINLTWAAATYGAMGGVKARVKLLSSHMLSHSRDLEGWGGIKSCPAQPIGS